MPVQVCACPAMPVPTRVYSAMPVPVRAMPAPACPGLLHASSTRSRCLSQVMRCVFFQLPVSFRIRKTARACAEPAPGLLHASSNLRLLAPHEVGVCHRLCPVSFGNFLCLSEAVRALRVSFRGRAPRVSFRGRGRGRASAGTPPHQHTCRAGAGFPTPALPAIRT